MESTAGRPPIADNDACDTKREVLRSFSRFCGAMFLPPAVTIMSFAAGDRHEPVLVDRGDVARVEPAVVVEDGRGRLGPGGTGEDARPDHELAVVGDPELEARQRRPTAPKRYRSWVFGGGRAHREARSPRGCRCPLRRRTRRSPWRAARAEIGARRRPPSRSFTFEKTRRSAIPTRVASARGTGLPPRSARAAADVERPVDQASLHPVASANVDVTAVWTFS